MGVRGRIVTRERHQLPVGRHLGVGVEAWPGGQRPHRAAGNVERVHLRVLVAAVPLRVLEAVEDDRLAIRGEVEPDVPREAVEPGTDVPLAARELPRRATVRGHEEEVRVPGLREPDAILAVVQPVDDPRRLRPLGAGRGRGHADLPGLLVGDEHRERDRFAVGRPLRVGRGLSDMGDLRGRAFGVHPAHEQLRALGLAVGEIQDPRAVRRPAGARAFPQSAVLGAVGVHHPERRLPLVLELVHVAPGVDDLRPVGRELRVGDLLPVEVMLDGEERVGRGFLSRGGRSSEKPGDDQNGNRETGVVTHTPSGGRLVIRGSL